MLSARIGLALLAIFLATSGGAIPTQASSGIWYVEFPGGQDSAACGTTNAPCRSITYTINQRAAGGDTLRLAGFSSGTFTENLSIAKPITLEGGYAPGGWTRDISKNRTEINGSYSQTLIGDWDNAGINTASVISDGGTYKMWYGAWGLLGHKLIGLATSTDGTTWTKNPDNPRLSPSESWEGTDVGRPAVIKDGAIYKMWYSSGDTKIGYATSSDGVSWTKYAANPIMTGAAGTWDANGVAGPFVLKVSANDYRMWYQNQEATGIGYATSADGIAWTKHSGAVLTPASGGAWDNLQIADPDVLYDGTTFRMWYSSCSDQYIYQIGYATSSDGIHWTRSASNPVFSHGASGTWDDFMVVRPNVILAGGQYKMWYTGFLDNWQAPQRGYATSTDGLHWTRFAGNPVLKLGTPVTWGQPVVKFTAGSDGSVIDGIIIDLGSAESGGGVLVDNARVTIQNSWIYSNTAYTNGGGIAIRNQSNVLLQNNSIENNSTTTGGSGSGVSIDSSEAHLIGNKFRGNRGYSTNGNGTIGISTTGSLSKPVTLVNNILVDNGDKGIMVGDGITNMQVINNTISNNTHEGILAWGAITISIFRNNIVTGNGGCGIAASAGAAYTVIDHNDVWDNLHPNNGNYCDYNGTAKTAPAAGAGDIAADPMFKCVACGDYSLLFFSPCINKGNPAEAPLVDMTGSTRDGVPDMGAYEFIPRKVFLPLLKK